MINNLHSVTRAQRTPLSLVRLISFALVAIGICGASPSALAQSSKLTGTVTSPEGQPMANVAVTDLTNQRKVFTDAAGKWELPANGDSTKLELSIRGYETLNLKVANGQALNLTLEKSASIKEEVLVDGVRLEALSPITQTTIGPKEIKDQYYGQDPTAMLQNTPNVLASFDGGNAFSNYSFIRIRGLDYSRINITLNGVPLNDMMDQGVFFSNMPDFTNSVRSIQIQRGVGTSTNGTVGYAGSINFESLYLRDQPAGGEVQLGYGSFNTMRYSAAVSSGLNNGWAFYGKYGALRSSGYRYNSGTEGGSFFGSAGYFGKKDIVRITAFHGAVKNQLAFAPVPLELINLDPRTNINSPSSTDEFGQSLVSVQHAHFLNEHNTITTTAYYGRANGWFDFSAADRLGLTNQHTGISTILAHTKGNLTAHFGAQGNVFLRENWYAQKPENNTRLYNNWGRKDEASTFAKASYSLGNFSLFGDVQLRYAAFTYLPQEGDPVSSRSKSWLFLNPKAGMSYNLSSAMSLYTSVGMVSREPTRSDLLQGNDLISVANQDTTGNFDLVKPERLLDWELGLNLNYHWLTGQVNLFWMEFRDEIAATGAYTSWFVPLRKNVAESFRRGVEWNVQARVHERVKLLAQGAYTNAKIKEFTTDFDGQTFRNVTPLLTPEWILSQGVDVKAANWANVSLLARYSSGSFLANNDDRNLTTPAFWLVDARVNLSYGERYSLAIYCNNLLDVRYYTNGAVGFDQNGNATPALLVQAPRNLMATATFRF